MEATHPYQRENIRKEDANVVKVVSFDQELPRINQIGESVDNIQRHVLKNDVNIYPDLQNTLPDKIKNSLYQRIQQLSKTGLAYVADNLFISASVSRPKSEPKPDDVILDVCLLVQDLSPTVITLVKDQSASVDSAKAYNMKLAKCVTAAVRSFTKEQFSVVFGTVSESVLKSQERFEQRLRELEEEKASWCIPKSLCMPKQKCKNVIRAFLSSVALTSSVVNDDNSDTLWFLTLEQFCILTENIDKREVIVRTAPSTGGKVLMREVARRLERSGPTLLVMESEEQIKVARDQETCSFMLTMGEWKEKLAKTDSLNGITHMVTNCQDCPSLHGLKGRSWSFSTYKSGDENSEAGAGTGSVDVKTYDISPNMNMSKSELIDIIEDLKKSLETERQTREKENAWLWDDNATLMKTEEELTQMLESISISGMSLDSGHGSYTSSVDGWRRRYVSSSVVSVDSEGGTGGLGMAKKLLKNVKKRLMMGRSKMKAVKEVYVYMYTLTNEEKTSSFLLQCRQQELNKNRVNTDKCHVNDEGQLVNAPSINPDKSDSQRFRKYRGTCSSSPIIYSTLTPAYSAPQYWETESDVEVEDEGKWLKWPPILEIGVVEEHQLDRDMWVHGRSRTWCVRVGECEKHRPGFCTQVWDQKYLVKCFPDTISDTPGTSVTLKYGAVLDVTRNRLGFIDNERGILLHKMDVKFRETLYPVFGVFSDIPGPKKMSLISGNDITMTKEKESLICSCLL